MQRIATQPLKKGDNFDWDEDFLTNIGTVSVDYATDRVPYSQQSGLPSELFRIKELNATKSKNTSTGYDETDRGDNGSMPPRAVDVAPRRPTDDDPVTSMDISIEVPCIRPVVAPSAGAQWRNAGNNYGRQNHLTFRRLAYNGATAGIIAAGKIIFF
ncbi:hypothetical protein Trydic_g15411 [Trypoxylus dichotomus]